MPWIIVATLTVFVPLILVYSYLAKRTVAAIVTITQWDRRRVRFGVLGTLSYVNLYPILFLVAFLAGGRTRIPAFSGDNVLVDLLFAYPFWISLVIAVQSFIVFLLIDGIRLAHRLAAPRKQSSGTKFSARATIIALAMLSIYSIAVIIKDTWTVRVVEKNVVLHAKGADLGGTKIVLVSDVQGDGRTNERVLTDYVEQINRQHPDFVLFAGDLVTSGEDYIASTARIMGGIHAPFGKYAAVGDHDMFSDKDQVIREMRLAGFVIADDTTVAVKLPGGTVDISLVTKTYLQSPRQGQLEDIARQNSGVFRIFLVHQPAEDLVQFAAQQGYDLFAAGHTHGGGVAFGIPGLYMFAPANLEGKYISGFYEYERMPVVVTNGIGMTLAPIRFHAPSEITVLNLVRPKGGSEPHEE